jgi:hypothetical protein
MKKLIVVAFILAGLTFVACNKDDDNNDTGATTIDLLASGTWKIDTIGFDGNKDGIIDEEVPGGLGECQLDNTITFNKDSATGVFDEGALKCDSADPQTVNFGYQLKGDTVINFTGDLPAELQGDVNIQSLTNTEFIMSKRIVIVQLQIDKNLIISLKK